MSTYVLVHGAWHGSWCWEPVATRLRQSGHKVTAVDLPGRAGDTTPHRDITLEMHADAVRKAIETASEPVVLVGHSMGGIVISETAERCTEDIRSLVYVCAFLLRDGQSLFDMAQADTASLVTPNLVADFAQGSATLKAGAPLKEMFYGHCPDADAVRALAMLGPEPLPPLGSPVRTTSARFGKIPRAYVECLRDKAITPAAQRQMISATGVDRVLAIDTDHSPFFSEPATLAVHLASLSQP